MVTWNNLCTICKISLCSLHWSSSTRFGYHRQHVLFKCIYQIWSDLSWVIILKRLRNRHMSLTPRSLWIAYILHKFLVFKLLHLHEHIPLVKTSKCVFLLATFPVLSIPGPAAVTLLASPGGKDITLSNYSFFHVDHSFSVSLATSNFESTAYKTLKYRSDFLNMISSFSIHREIKVIVCTTYMSLETIHKKRTEK